MKSRLGIIFQVALIALAAIATQSCDSTLTIDKPGTFLKYIGGDGSQTGTDMVTDSEGSIYILGGTTSIDSAQQLFVVKLSSEGNVIWEQAYGGPGDETAKDIELMSDGNLLMLGDVSISGERDFVIYLLNAVDGTTIRKRKGGVAGKNDYANTITQTSDGFMVAAYIDEGSFKSGWVRRFHADLTEFGPEWTSDVGQLKGGSGFDVVPVKVFQFSPTSFYVFGYTNTTISASTDYNAFILVTNNVGVAPTRNTLFPRGPSAGSDERVTSVAQLPASAGGGYAISGYSSSNGSQDLFVTRVVGIMDETSSDAGIVIAPGSTLISSGISSISSSSSATIYPSVSKGLFVLGERNVTGSSDLYLTKVDNFLSELWSDPISRSFGGVGSDMAGAVVEANDGSILVCGTMVLGDALGQQKIVLMKLNPDGMLGK